MKVIQQLTMARFLMQPDPAVVRVASVVDQGQVLVAGDSDSPGHQFRIRKRGFRREFGQLVAAS